MKTDCSQLNHKLVWESDNTLWEFESIPNFTASQIKKSVFLIAISLRNPSFSNAWLENVLTDIKHFGGSAIVSLVDTPYISSVHALSKSRSEMVTNLGRLKKEREQHLLRVRQSIADFEQFTTLIDWNDLIALTPKEYNAEIIQGFSKSSKTQELVLRQVKKAFPEENSDETLKKLSKFFIEEVPVLCFLYYVLWPGCIDVYPGTQADFFWCLEKGELKEELPNLSKLAISNLPHLYACVKLKPNEQ